MPKLIPSPEELEPIFGEDHLCNLLFRELIYRASNQDRAYTDERRKTVMLKRGQAIFSRRKYAAYLSQDDKKIQRALEKLEKVYQQVGQQADHNFTLVAINNYDRLVRFGPASGPAMGQQWASNGPATLESFSDSPQPEANNDQGQDGASVATNQGQERKTERERKESNKEKKEREKKKESAVVDTSSSLVLSSSYKRNSPFPITEDDRRYALRLGFNEWDVDDFVSYWTEANSQGRQRWQFEKTFDLRRRMVTRSTMFDRIPHAKPPIPEQVEWGDDINAVIDRLKREPHLKDALKRDKPTWYRIIYEV